MIGAHHHPLRRWLARLAAPALAVAGLTVAAGPAHATTSANLLLNPGAETAQCSTGGWEETTVPGWQITAADPVINCYGVPTGAATSTPGSPTEGTAYFQGGSRGTSQLAQVVDVSAAATAIDGGGVHATLSGWLGGIGGYDDAAKVTATYRNASGGSLGSAAIGPVLAADRGNTTEFLQRATTGSVPAGTRSILVTVDFTMTGTQNDGMADDLSLTLDTALTPPALTVPPSTVPAYDHVFLIMMENNNYSATSNTVDGGAGIIGNSAAPYVNNTLVPMGALLTNYHAGTHNSDPNYEQIAFGNSYGRSTHSSNCITDPACTATNNGLSDNLDAAGKSWKQYVQSQTSNCQTTSSGNYENDDVPFYYAAKMKNDTAYCQAHWQPLPQLLTTDLAQTGTTPAFVWFDPDSCDDMEGCGVGPGDTWLSQTLPTLFASPAWTRQRSLLIVTWDEDGNNLPGGFGPGQTNQVPTIVIGSQNTVPAGYRAAGRYDHYSTARVIESALGLTSTMTNNDKWATPYDEVFGASPDLSGTHNLTTSGQALDDPGSSTATGTQLITWGLHGGANQQWTFARQSDGSYTLTNGASGLCADVTGSSTSAGAAVIQWTCTGNANQRWAFTRLSDGSYTAKSVTSGLLLTTASTSDGALVTQQADSGSALQHWTLG